MNVRTHPSVPYKTAGPEPPPEAWPMDANHTLDLLILLTAISVSYMVWVLWHWILEEKRPATIGAGRREHIEPAPESEVAIWPPRPQAPARRLSLPPALSILGRNRS